MAYELDIYADPQVTQVSFFANRIYGNFTRSSQPTLEGNAGTDSMRGAIADGAVVTDVLDGQRKTRLTIDDDGEGAAFRLDLDLNDFIVLDFAFVDNHNLRTSYAEALRNNIALWHDTDGTYNGSTELVPAKIFSGLINKRRPYLKFDGINDVITRADSTAFSDPFTRDTGFTIPYIITPRDITSGNQGHFSYLKDVNNYFTAQINSSGQLEMRAKVNGTESRVKTGTGLFTANKAVQIVFAKEAGETHPVIYVNNVAQTPIAQASELGYGIQTGWNLGRTRIAGVDKYGKVNFHQFEFYNYYLSSDEVAILYANWTHTPIPTANQWGIDTEKITAVNDRTFAGASNWTNNNIDAYDETTGSDLTIAASAAWQSCYLPNTAFGSFTQGAKYRLTYDHTERTGTWIFRIGGSDEIIGTAVAGTGNTIEFEVEESGSSHLYIVAITSDADGDFDNFSLVEIGCVAEFTPDGINPHEGIWYDTSTNSLDGTISGATEKDCPTAVNGDGDLTLYEFTEIEKQYLFYRFNADGLTADDDSEIGQIGAGKKFTPSTRPDFNMIKREGYGLDGVEALSGRRSSVKRHGKRRRWQLSWSYISQAERDDFQEFFDTIEIGDPWSAYPFIFTLNYDANEPVFHIGRIIGIPEVRDLTYQAYAVSLVIETEV